MKRAIFLATAALLVMLVLAPVALALDTTQMGPQTEGPGGPTAMTQGPSEGTAGKANKPLPPSGGPEILLPAAALLLGSVVLTYAVLRRR